MSSAASAGQPFTMTLDEGGIVRLVWERGIAVTASLARAAMGAADELCRPTPRPMLVSMTMVSVDRPARAVFGEPSLTTRIALVGTSAVDRLIAGFVTRISKPAVPTKFFAEETAALTWLKADSHGD